MINSIKNLCNAVNKETNYLNMESSKQKTCGCFWYFTRKPKRVRSDKSTSTEFQSHEKFDINPSVSPQLKTNFVKSSSLSSTQKFLAPTARKSTIFTPFTNFYNTQNSELHKLINPSDSVQSDHRVNFPVKRNSSLPEIHFKMSSNQSLRNLIVDDIINSGKHIDYQNSPEPNKIDLRKKIEENKFSNNFLFEKIPENKIDEENKNEMLFNKIEYESLIIQETKVEKIKGKFKIIPDQNIKKFLTPEKKQEKNSEEYLVSSPNATLIPNENFSIKENSFKFVQEYFNSPSPIPINEISKFINSSIYSNAKESESLVGSCKINNVVEEINNVFNINEEKVQSPEIFKEFKKSALNYQEKKKLPPLKPVTPHYFSRKRMGKKPKAS